MGHFSNGTEGECYEAEWCSRCVHSGPKGKPCAVWGAHLLHCYGAQGEAKQILDELIPRASSGIGNKRCTMFVTVEDVTRKRRERAMRDQGQLPGVKP